MASMHEDVHHRARKQQQKGQAPKTCARCSLRSRNAEMAKNAKQTKNVRDVQKLP